MKLVATINVAYICMIAVFIIFVGYLIIAGCVKLITWYKNNHTPTTEVQAKCVSKREFVINKKSPGASNVFMKKAYTAYYLTFELDNEGCVEYEVYASDYMSVAEGDVGVLTYQGTRFVAFHKVK